MTSTIDGNSVTSDSTQIDDTDSPYTTSGEDIIEVDVSSGAVTVTLASADVTAGNELRIIDDSGNASTNNITVNTEGSETIDPGGVSSKSITVDDAELSLETNGSNWNATNRNQEAELIDTDGVDVAGSDLVASGDFLATGPTAQSDPAATASTTSTSYVNIGAQARGLVQWDQWDTGQSAAIVLVEVFTNQGDYRLQNTTDGETILENLNTGTGKKAFGPTNYTPTTTASPIEVRLQAKNDNGNQTDCERGAAHFGVQV